MFLCWGGGGSKKKHNLEKTSPETLGLNAEGRGAGTEWGLSHVESSRFMDERGSFVKTGGLKPTKRIEALI